MSCSSKLAAKRAFITGGAGGIGSAIALLFASEGAQVIIHDLPQSAGIAIAEAINNETSSSLVQFVSGDLVDEVALTSAFQAQGPFDILINNAAVDPKDPIETYSIAEFDRILGINARAAFILSQLSAPMMKQRGGGAIVNTMSTQLSGNWPDKVPYVMSKGALLGLTRSLARELGPIGVRVNAVSPGAIPTAMEEKHWGGDRQAFDQSVMERQSLKFRGSVDDIAEAVLFLASEQSRFITGQELHVNGGLYMG